MSFDFYMNYAPYFCGLNHFKLSDDIKFANKDVQNDFFFKGIISLIILIKFLHNGFLNRTRIAEDFQQRIDVHSKAIMCATIWDGTALEQRIVCEHHAFNQYCELKFDGLLANNSKLDAVCTEGRLMTLLY